MDVLGASCPLMHNKKQKEQKGGVAHWTYASGRRVMGSNPDIVQIMYQNKRGFQALRNCPI